MPMYDFICSKCGATRKDLIVDAKIRNEIPCDKCGELLTIDYSNLRFMPVWKCDTGTVSKGKPCKGE